MLTLLEEVLQSASAFPRGHAELFSRYLCRLVIRERQNPRGVELIDALFDPEDLRDMADPRQPLLPPDAPFFTALARLAYDGQRREFKGEPQEVNFARRAVRQTLDNDQWTLARALHLLIEAETCGQYRFRHQQFQEYFAALELARSGEVALAQAPWRPDQFQRGLAEVRDELPAWGQLPPVDRSGWEETARMAAELAEDGDDFIARLAEVNLPLAGQSAAPERVAVNLRANLAERLLARMRDDRADLRARIAAGHALGEMEMLEVLGYRALARNGQRIAWLPPVETIPGGEYTFGSQDDPEADSDEHRFSQRLAEFALGRFPVTNAEWGCFIKAGGYEEPRWWRGEASRRYREQGSNEGEIYFLKSIRQVVRAQDLDLEEVLAALRIGPEQ
ncbi:MAG TPA: hypothetical protein ENK26_01840, partial [Gammaproteobacteria bacterium]|nr:hypothetical protein [Gammaproteobacteria bacterium]